MIACCGLNCAKCDAYLATIENDDGKREATAKKWTKLYGTKIDSSQINCHGCKSDSVRFFHCASCDIRRCCLSKGVDHCAACREYICEKLSNFIKLAPEAGQALEKIRSLQLDSE